MERRLKERLIGAAVLVMAAVIFIPMVLDDSIQDENEITGTNIPGRPKTGSASRIVPEQAPAIEDIPPLLTETVETEAAGEEAQNEGVPAVQQQEAVAAVKPEEKERAAPVNGAAEKAPAKKANVIMPAPGSVEQTETEKKGLTAWVVQLGSFSSRENADNLSEKLRQAGYPAFVEPVKSGSETAYRVRVGPELLRSDAQALQKKLDQNFQQKGIVLRYP